MLLQILLIRLFEDSLFDLPAVDVNKRYAKKSCNIVFFYLKSFLIT